MVKKKALAAPIKQNLKDCKGNTEHICEMMVVRFILNVLPCQIQCTGLRDNHRSALEIASLSDSQNT